MPTVGATQRVAGGYLPDVRPGPGASLRRACTGSVRIQDAKPRVSDLHKPAGGCGAPERSSVATAAGEVNRTRSPPYPVTRSSLDGGRPSPRLARVVLWRHREPLRLPVGRIAGTITRRRGRSPVRRRAACEARAWRGLDSLTSRSEGGSPVKRMPSYTTRSPCLPENGGRALAAAVRARGGAPALRGGPVELRGQLGALALPPCRGIIQLAGSP